MSSHSLRHCTKPHVTHRSSSHWHIARLMSHRGACARASPQVYSLSPLKCKHTHTHIEASRSERRALCRSRPRSADVVEELVRAAPPKVRAPSRYLLEAQHSRSAKFGEVIDDIFGLRPRSLHMECLPWFPAGECVMHGSTPTRSSTRGAFSCSSA